MWLLKRFNDDKTAAELFEERFQAAESAYEALTPDVGLAWALCDRVAVMYLGRIIEQGTTEQVLSDPRHPYTQALLSVVPSPVPRADGDRRMILEGELPDASRIPSGCRFHPRCPVAFDRCRTDDPEELSQVGGGHVAACWKVGG